MRQTDVRQTDVRQKHHLMRPPYGGRGIITITLLLVLLCICVVPKATGTRSAEATKSENNSPAGIFDCAVLLLHCGDQ